MCESGNLKEKRAEKERKAQGPSIKHKATNKLGHKIKWSLLLLSIKNKLKMKKKKGRQRR